MRIGDGNLDKFLKIYEDRGTLPAILENAPELFPHLVLVWKMYQMLGNSRGTTFSGIWFFALSEIRVALDLFEIDDIDTRLYYVELLQRLDRFYVNDWYQKNAPKKK